jgi:hypothetical protein
MSENKNPKSKYPVYDALDKLHTAVKLFEIPVGTVFQSKGQKVVYQGRDKKTGIIKVEIL